jgi:hypothetical protein
VEKGVEVTANATQKGRQQQPRRRIGRLKTASDVARYIARTIKSVEKGEGENRAYKLVMMASLLLRALETSTIEARILALEERLQKGNHEPK